jgi:hypothetical protein
MIACLFCGFCLGQVLLAPTVQAQRGQSESKLKAVAYEYCAITRVSSSLSGDKIRAVAKICYMQEPGIQCQEVEATVVGDRNSQGYIFDKVGNDALAKAIAKLGSEGWEMIGKGLPLPRGQKMSHISSVKNNNLLAPRTPNIACTGARQANFLRLF